MEKVVNKENQTLITHLFWEFNHFSQYKGCLNSLWLPNLDNVVIGKILKLRLRVSDKSQWTFSVDNLDRNQSKIILINDKRVKRNQAGFYCYDKNWKFQSLKNHSGWQAEVIDVEFDENDGLSAYLVLKICAPVLINTLVKLKQVDYATVLWNLNEKSDRAYYDDLFLLILGLIKIDFKKGKSLNKNDDCQNFINEIEEIKSQKINAQSLYYQIVATYNRYFGKYLWWKTPFPYCDNRLMWLNGYWQFKEALLLKLDDYYEQCQTLLLESTLTLDQFKTRFLSIYQWVTIYRECEIKLDQKMKKIIQSYFDEQGFNTLIRNEVENKQDWNDLGFQISDIETLEALKFKQNIKNKPNQTTNDLPENVKAKIEFLESELKSNRDRDNYRLVINTLKKLPWTKKQTPAPIEDLRARLDQYQYGMDDVKKRLVNYFINQEYLRTCGAQIDGQILCLVGNPGVGKSSFAKALSLATNVPLIKISCGTLTSVDSLYGSTPVYLGARAGAIIKQLMRVQVNNPIILLDEIDKVNSQLVACLLDLLDPEQNDQFEDQFIQFPFSLKNVTFIATANSLENVDLALVDRLDVIKINDYQRDDVYQIVKRYLIPKLLKVYQWKDENDFPLLDDQLLNEFVDKYYYQGLREINRQLQLLASECLVINYENRDKDRDNQEKLN